MLASDRLFKRPVDDLRMICVRPWMGGNHAACRVRRNKVDLGQRASSKSALADAKYLEETAEETLMSEITHFIAMPVDQTDQGFVAGEAFKCASPASAIERAKGFWKIFGHAGAVAFVRTGYPDTQTTVLRRFGSVPDEFNF